MVGMVESRSQGWECQSLWTGLEALLGNFDKALPSGLQRSLEQPSQDLMLYEPVKVLYRLWDDLESSFL